VTIKKRHTITLDEIVAFELTCKKCLISSTIPVGSDVKISGECPHCKASWLSLISKAFEQLKAGMGEIVKHSQDEDAGCVFSVEVKGTDDKDKSA
jgi:Zn-finger nucleic acid-binding protein